MGQTISIYLGVIIDWFAGLTAVALFDYQKADDDEITFEPNDVITNIEQVR